MSYIIFSLYRNGVDSMNQTPEVTGFDLPQSTKSTPETPNVLPGYHKCLSCMDYGVSCNGPNLVALGDIGAVRTFHKVMKRSRKLSLKAIADAAPTISDSTINEYFSNTAKDYKWTTVGAIDNAITAICGNRIGLPPLDQSCPAASSEVRQQIAAADLKVAASCRGKGIGKALMDAGLQEASNRNYRGIYLQAQDDNLGACLFYLKCGFQIGGFDNRVYGGTSQAHKADILFYLDKEEKL